MMNPELRNARRNLDRRLSQLKPEDRFKVPPKGWSKAIRTAIGMTGVQFAARLGVTPQTADALERSETNGTIQLATLRRAADALDCTLVYAFVPKTSLDEAVNDRARKLALNHLSKVAHSMKLEGQNTGGDDLEERIQDHIRNHLAERDLWRVP